MFSAEKAVVVDMTGIAAYVERFTLEEEAPIAAPTTTGATQAGAAFTEPSQPFQVSTGEWLLIFERISGKASRWGQPKDTVM